MEVCRTCLKAFDVIKTGNKTTNGSFERKYPDGGYCPGKTCRDCLLGNQRAYRLKTKNKTTFEYERSVPGFIMRKYRNIKSRICGVQKLKQHLYAGKELLSKDAFYEWVKSSHDFKKLYAEWEASGFNRKLCPSVDRIDSSKGYSIDNMRWITHSENSRLGALSRFGISSDTQKASR